jgi:hypothetical protein
MYDKEGCMDPFTIIAARELHAERVAEAARQRSRWGAASVASDVQGDTWLGRLARLVALPLRRSHHRPSDKQVAA